MQYAMYSKKLFQHIQEVTTKLVGPLPVIKTVWNMLGAKNIIDRVCPTEGDAPISDSVLAMVSNRLSSPEPLSNIEEWVENSAFASVMDVADVAYNDDRLGRALDAAGPDVKSVWTQILFKAVTAFNLELDSVFYDITSIYFEGDYKESLLLSHGYSRDDKPDKKQINLALNCSQKDSIPLWYKLFKGNTNDQTTVLDNMAQLDKLTKELPSKPGKNPMVVIGDRLMLNDEIAVGYDRLGIKFIGTMDDCKAQQELIRFVPDEILKSSPLHYKGRAKDLYHGVNLPHVFSHRETTKGEKHCILESVAHVFFSESKDRQDKKSFDKKIKKVEEVFKFVADKLNQRKYRSKEYAASQLQTKLKGKSGRFFFEYEVLGEEGALSLSWRLKKEKVEQARALFGKYVIYTNDPSKTLEMVLKDYKDKDKVEKFFSGLKGPFKVRPIFLQKDERIEALVFVILLSYLIFSLVRLSCKRHNLKITEKSFIRIFRSLHLVEIRMKDGATFAQVGTLTKKQKDIMFCLKVRPP